MFCYAQKAVLYATAPLYSVDEQNVRVICRIFCPYSSALVHVLINFSQFSHLLAEQLTEKCKSALRRIFNVCDIDGDGLLNGYELAQLQRHCFNASNQPQAFERVKAVLSKSYPGGIACDGLTLDGFVFLHAALMQRGRIETAWAVLRGFGYNDQLDMVEGYLQPAFEMPPGSSSSSSGMRFSDFRLKHLWNST